MQTSMPNIIFQANSGNSSQSDALLEWNFLESITNEQISKETKKKNRKEKSSHLELKMDRRIARPMF